MDVHGRADPGAVAMSALLGGAVLVILLDSCDPVPRARECGAGRWGCSLPVLGRTKSLRPRSWWWSTLREQCGAPAPIGFGLGSRIDERHRGRWRADRQGATRHGQPRRARRRRRAGRFVPGRPPWGGAVAGRPSRRRTPRRRLLLDLNSATLESLENLPGIGPVIGTEDPRLPAGARRLPFGRRALRRARAPAGGTWTAAGEGTGDPAR